MSTTDHMLIVCIVSNLLAPIDIVKTLVDFSINLAYSRSFLIDSVID